MSTADEEFEELCFQFGLEIDDIVDDPEKGMMYKVEVAANRYDLLCIEGIALSLRMYLGKGSFPKYGLMPAKHPEQYRLMVKPSTALVSLSSNIYFTILSVISVLHLLIPCPAFRGIKILISHIFLYTIL